MNVSLTQPNTIWERLLSALRNSPPMRYPDLGLTCLGLFVELVGVGAIVPIRSIYARDHGATAAETGLLGAGFMMGPALGGLMVDAFGYTSPFIFGGVMSLSTALFLMIKMTNRRPGERPDESTDALNGEDGAKAARQVPRKLFMAGLIATLL